MGIEEICPNQTRLLPDFFQSSPSSKLLDSTTSVFQPCGLSPSTQSRDGTPQEQKSLTLEREKKKLLFHCILVDTMDEISAEIHQLFFLVARLRMIHIVESLSASLMSISAGRALVSAIQGSTVSQQR